MEKLLQLLYGLYVLIQGVGALASPRIGLRPVVDRPTFQVGRVPIANELKRTGQVPIVMVHEKPKTRRQPPTAQIGYTENNKPRVVAYWVEMFFTIHGVYTRAIVTQEKLDHLTSNHGMELGLPLSEMAPLDPNMKKKSYAIQMVKAKLSNANKMHVLGVMDRILGLESPDEVEIFPEVQLRGSGDGLTHQHTAHVFRERSSGLVLAVYNSGEFESQIARLQPLDAAQLQRLRVENKMD